MQLLLVLLLVQLQGCLLEFMILGWGYTLLLRLLVFAAAAACECRSHVHSD
jgi:hypothetical protein